MNAIDLLSLGLYLAVGFVVVIFLALLVMWLMSNKSLKHFSTEIVYELVYNVIGSKALLEDFIMTERVRCIEVPKASGKIALVTGGARGIGVEVVKKLLICDAHVIIGCRNVAAGQKLCKTIQEEGIETGNVEVFKLDLSSLESVKSFAAEVKAKYPKIHILINNAGKMFGPYMESEDGYESQFAVNYLGHFLLTHLLLPEIIAAGETNNHARIVNVTSCAHTVGQIDFKDINSRKIYIPSAAYSQSKLAQILFTYHLNFLLRDQDIPVNVYSVHPGIVDTELFNGTYLKKFAGSWTISKLFKTPAQGAASILYTALARKLEIASGTYISNCDIMPSSQMTYSTDLQQKMFDFTNDLLGIKVFGKE